MTVRARVRNGTLVVDEPTDLPEGTEVELTLIDDADELDDEDRERTHAALDRAEEQLKAGRYLRGEEVVARLRRNER